jgi:hypothetical protein
VWPQAELDLALRLTTLLALYGVPWSIVVLVQGRWQVLWWTVPTLPLAWLCGRKSPGQGFVTMSWSLRYPVLAGDIALICQK